MVLTRWLGIVVGFVAILISPLPLAADERPMTGRAIPEFAQVDQIVNDFMDLIGAEAASLAITHNGRSVFVRAYGWADKDKTTPTQPENTFRLASNTKPITAAIVRNLIKSRRIESTTPVFQYLSIEPYNGTFGDERIADITVGHLLEHKGGWDRAQTFDPMYGLDRIKQELGLESELTVTNLIEYMLAQPLQHTPGETRAYSNFGYFVLGRIIEKAGEATYDEVVQTNIARRLRVDDIRLSALAPEDRDPSEVFYPKESGLDIAFRDAAGGLTSSASSLCTFMKKYWVNGEVRNRRQKRSYFHTGSQPHSTTALMEQRSDGIDYVVLFNARRNGQYQTDQTQFRTNLNRAIDQIKRQSR